MITKNYEFLKLLNQKGYSQVKLAKLCGGITEARLSRIINGHDLPKKAEITRIASVLEESDSTILAYFITQKEN